MIKMNKDQMGEGTYSIKEIAVSFLQLVANGNVREAYKRHVDSSFCHHNPYFRGDSESLMLAMEEDAAKNPDKKLEVKRAIQENDTVMVQSHVKQNRDDLGFSTVHIFRFKDELIVELWDLVQPVPESSPNENGIF
jgi:predicted SnoaL-like aldol condensation-catalyzing enzyme